VETCGPPYPAEYAPHDLDVSQTSRPPGSGGTVVAMSDDQGPVDGDRLLLPCRGGPSTSRLVRHPPPIEIEERGGLYVLDDTGPREEWIYVFLPHQ